MFWRSLLIAAAAAVVAVGYTYQASMSQLAAAEAANVETEPANDGSRLLSSSSQSLVILYRVSDR